MQRTQRDTGEETQVQGARSCRDPKEVWRGGQPLHRLRPPRCSAPQPHLLASAGSTPRVLREAWKQRGLGLAPTASLIPKKLEKASAGLSAARLLERSQTPSSFHALQLCHRTLPPSCHCERTLPFSSEKPLLQGEPLLTPEGTARATRATLTGGRRGSGKAGCQSRSRPCPPSWVTSGQARSHSELHVALCTLT